MTVHLHLGAPKTATTTLQVFLAANREALAARGWCYPTSPGRFNHTQLSITAADPHREWTRFMAHTDDPAEVEALRGPFAEALRAEVAGADHVILSNEHAWERLHTAAEVERLVALVTSIDTDVRVYVYLRRQDQAYASLYSTQTIRRTRPPFDPHDGDVDVPWFAYGDLCDLWAGAVGRDRFVVRPFRRADWIDGDPLTDLCTLMGVPDHHLLPRPDDQHNQSLDAATIEFLRHANRLVPPFVDLRPNPVQAALVDGLRDLATGPQVRLAGPAAAALVERYADQNRRVARGYLANPRDELFDPVDPTDAGQGLGLTVEDTVALAVGLHQRHHDRLEAVLAERDAWKRKARKLARRLDIELAADAIQAPGAS